MIKEKRLKGQDIYLRSLSTDEDLANYSAGINDIELPKYLEAGKRRHTAKDLQDYISSMNTAEDHMLFGIFSNWTGEHIGNITLDNIDMSNRKAEIAIFLWMHHSRGYAAEAINLLVNYAVTDLDLNRLYAGAALENYASVALFKKCGFKEEGILKMDYLKDDRYYDVIRFGLLKSRLQENNKTND
jgi:RimJ/RimL family protein N-acetyltransferase